MNCLKPPLDLINTLIIKFTRKEQQEFQSKAVTRRLKDI